MAEGWQMAVCQWCLIVTHTCVRPRPHMGAHIGGLGFSGTVCAPKMGLVNQCTTSAPRALRVSWS